MVDETRELLLVLSGPGGAGKTSLALEWHRRAQGLVYSRSTTTRKARDGLAVEEQYDYVEVHEFAAMCVAGDFVQWVSPPGLDSYGTPRVPVDDALERGDDVVFDYCPEGFLNLRRAYPRQTVGIFVVAPSLDILRKRIAGRRTETPEEIELRLEMAAMDFGFIDDHQYLLVNDDFEEALKTLESIRHAEKSRIVRSRAATVFREASRPALLKYY